MTVAFFLLSPPRQSPAAASHATDEVEQARQGELLPNGKGNPAGQRPAAGRQGDQGRQRDPQDQVRLGRRPRQLQRQRLRLLRRGQLHAARRPDAEDADDLRIARRWGKKKKGKWITVYANSGHTYAMVAGLRWDTSGGPGPRWHKSKRSRAGYKVRHYKGY